MIEQTLIRYSKNQEKLDGYNVKQDLTLKEKISWQPKLDFMNNVLKPESKNQQGNHSDWTRRFKHFSLVFPENKEEKTSCTHFCVICS